MWSPAKKLVQHFSKSHGKHFNRNKLAYDFFPVWDGGRRAGQNEQEFYPSQSTSQLISLQ